MLKDHAEEKRVPPAKMHAITLENRQRGAATPQRPAEQIFSLATKSG